MYCRLGYQRWFRDDDGNRSFGNYGNCGVNGSLGRCCRRGGKPFLRHRMLRLGRRLRRRRVHLGFYLASAFGAFRLSCMFRLCCAFAVFG